MLKIWSLDGRIVQILDRAQTLPISSDASGPEPSAPDCIGGIQCVRDVSWHSQVSDMWVYKLEAFRGDFYIAGARFDEYCE
jgi:hypothetical protein